MRRLRILVDMDNIIVDMTPKWLKMYNRDHHDNVTMEDLKTWHISKHVKIGDKIHDYLYQERFFLDVPPMNGAIPTLRCLHEEGHHVRVVSAPSWPGNSATDKISWCREWMPWLNKRHISLMHEKYMLKGDVFIDDSPENIRLYREEWGQKAKIMTIVHPFSEPARPLVDVYAESYKNPIQAWAIIKAAIDKVADEE